MRPGSLPGTAFDQLEGKGVDVVTQFERMKRIYREAKHIHYLATGNAKIVAADTFRLIGELCDEMAKMTGRAREWETFKESLE